LTILLVVGIKESAKLNNVLVFIKTGIVVLVIACGFAFVNVANWHPFVPPNTGHFGEFGWSGVARGAGLVFFAYIGFDAVSTAAQEARNPQRDLPIGMLGSLAICTVLYLLMALVMTGLVKYTQLNVPAPVVVALGNVPQLNWLRIVTDLGVIVGLASTVLVMLLGQTRVSYSMARDGLLPVKLGAVHPKFGTPYVVTIFIGALCCLLAAFFPVGLLATLVNIGTLLAFVVVSAGVWVLRVRQPELPRPFRTPFVPLVPILGILFCFGLILTLPSSTWYRLIVWTLIGFVIYFLYGRKHSRAAAAAGQTKAPVAAD
jgi:APA family basic amino acid/polyamine antiporter